MKYVNRILSVLTILCCLAGAWVPVHASQDGPVPKVVFINEKKLSPDLYVSKQVESAEAGREAPAEDEFTFVLRLNGAFADQRVYRLYDADGQEILEKDAVGGTVIYKTDQNGTFTLKAGQTAQFEQVGVGTLYEIREEARENYEQIEPAGAMASDTMTLEGAAVEFRNRYLPGGTGGETVRLEVRKQIAFPAGYTVPETPDFVFQLKVSRAPWSGKTYTVIDNETGAAAGGGVTDENGRFGLKGGCRAVFENIPADADYELSEILEEPPAPETETAGSRLQGWHAVGASVRRGTTKGPLVSEIFVNTNASFVVTKQMQDSSRPEDEFHFLLTKEDGSKWAGCRYYLYNTTGELVTDVPSDDLEGIPGLREIDPDGTFPLKAEQSAVFIGLDPGTVYSVSEVGEPGYKQVAPFGAEGYAGQMVGNMPQVLRFVNDKVELNGVLTVTKQVENVKEGTSDPQELFHFVLKDAEGRGIKNAVYSVVIGNSSATYQTKEADTGKGEQDGEFTIKANETARFEGLPAGTYTIEEIKLPEGYEAGEIRCLDSTGEHEAEEPDAWKISGALRNTGTAAFVFKNLYRPDQLDLQLLKQSPSGAVLKDVKFELWKVSEGEEAEPDGTIETDWEKAEKSKVGELSTDEEGMLTFQNLTEGTYFLKEVKTTAGYQLPDQPLKITVTWTDDSRKQAELTVTGGLEGDTSQFVSGEYVRDKVELEITNEYLYELPKTGGTGTGPYRMIGFALLSAAFGAAFIGRRRRTDA